jgi:hypothetical protein
LAFKYIFIYMHAYMALFTSLFLPSFSFSRPFASLAIYLSSLLYLLCSRSTVLPFLAVLPSWHLAILPFCRLAVLVLAFCSSKLLPFCGPLPFDISDTLCPSAVLSFCVVLRVCPPLLTPPLHTHTHAHTFRRVFDR